MPGRPRFSYFLLFSPVIDVVLRLNLVAMEPMEVNAGRFYCRPLRQDSRVDDAPAMSRILGYLVDPGEFSYANKDWHADKVYRFAVCEQTNVDLIALAIVSLHPDNEASILVRPDGSTDRVLPNDDDTLEKVTVGDGITAAERALGNWVEGFLERKLR